ncbi:hypothetical protein LX16_4352 [Stackebrandtia albiflava]|uniref:Uncharacterized protein n=1 Tax=Stackebrandtia albiflava TaxID=406432 RepID=A0A562UR90_9ACTN|nr:hypothetical protein [Stackebrandtia albiflava]TWJ08132.1 hypothetical protein LX16_4352 [Stackebrandtia albiflava]
MAFSLAQALPEAGTVPFPWAPQIRRAHLAALRLRLAVSVAAWLVVGGGVGWTTAVLTWARPPEWLAVVPSGAVVAVLVSVVAVTAIATLDGIGPALVVVWGYGRPGAVAASGYCAAPPRALRGLGAVAAGAGLSTGLAAGVATALLTSTGRGVGAALVAAAALLVSGIIGLFVAVSLPRLVKAWRAERRRAAERDRVYTTGSHVVGRVTAADYQGYRLDAQPVFRMTLEYPVREEIRRVEFLHADHPCWAPLPGNEFDVRYDPASPDDPETTVLERRIVGQSFDPDTAPLRQGRHEGESFLTTEAPDWALPDTKASPARVRYLLYRACTVNAVAAVLVAGAAVAWTTGHGLTPWWLVPCLLVMSTLYTCHAAWWWGMLRRADRVADRLWSPTATAWLGCGLAGAVVATVLVSVAPGAEPGGVVLFTGAAALLAGFGGVTNDSVPEETRWLTGDTPPPVDEVRQAIRSGDPEALPRLAARHGYRAGPRHAP